MYKNFYFLLKMFIFDQRFQNQKIGLCSKINLLWFQYFISNFFTFWMVKNAPFLEIFHLTQNFSLEKCSCLDQKR